MREQRPVAAPSAMTYAAFQARNAMQQRNMDDISNLYTRFDTCRHNLFSTSKVFLSSLELL